MNAGRTSGARGAIPRDRGEQGVALVLALLFVVLLTALVVDFTYELQVDASQVGAQADRFEAYVAAKSAVSAGMGLLAMDLLLSEDLVATGAVTGEFDSYEDAWAVGIPMAPLNKALYQTTVTDEYGKLNLNALIVREPGGEAEVIFAPLEERLRAFFELRELTETSPDAVVDAIIDWLDSDDEPEPDGVETEYYMQLDPPFMAKNGPMDSIEELLLIPGITPEVYYGDPDKDQLPLSDLLTVHGHPQGRVNVNTAPFEVLMAHFMVDDRFPGDPAAMAEDLFRHLDEFGPFTSLEQLQQANYLPTPEEQQQQQQQGDQQQNENENEDENDPDNPPLPVEPPMLDVLSYVFRIDGDGEAGNAMVRVQAYVWRDTVASGAGNMFRVIDWNVIQ